MSFYGNQKGSSVLIKKAYDKLQELKADFALPTCEVGYGEFALVKYDTNNTLVNQIYKRTYSEPELITFLTQSNNYTTNFQLQYTQVPGYDGIKFIDEPVSSVDSNNSQVTFNILAPYQVIDCELNGKGTLNKEQFEEHPYYQKWIFSLPSIKIRVIEDPSLENIIYLNGDPFQPDTDRDEIKPVLVYDEIIGDNVTTYYIQDYSFIEDVYTNEFNEIVFAVSQGKEIKFDFQMLKEISLDDDGTLTQIFNRGDPLTAENKLTWINDIKYENQELIFKYNNDTKEPLSIQIPKGIKSISMDESKCLIIKYSDNSIDNLGSVKDEGLLVERNYTKEELKIENYEVNTILAILNSKKDDNTPLYPSNGKIITVGDADKEKQFYAYDFDKQEWYLISQGIAAGGSSSSSGGNIILEEEKITEDIIRNMPVGSIWFIVSGDED